MIEHHLRASLWLSALHIAGILILAPLLTPLLGATGAALAVLLAGMTGALASLWVLRSLQLTATIKRFWGIVLAAVVSGALSALMPAPWLVNLLFASGVYLALCWSTKALSTNDLQALRRLILPESSPPTPETTL